MSIESVPGTGLTYHLLAFDAEGRERPVDGSLSSQPAADQLAREPITDVFLMSHGWQGDIRAARDQYGRWVAAMAACAADRERARQVRPGFRSLLVGVHWPSLAWGDETLGPATASSASAAREGVDEYAARLGDTPPVRAALQTVFAAAAGPVPDRLPPDVMSAYEALDREVGLGAEGAGAAPGADREVLDPQQVFEDAPAVTGASFGFRPSRLDALLAPLRTLTFWKMKDRARRFGETGGNAVLAALQRAAGDRPVRFHLMGHSFGCIVVSAMLHGPDGHGGAVRQVETLTLVQGALSLWSYCADIPKVGRPGYFRNVLAERRVRGVVMTTQSEYDTAVGRWYPLAAGVAGQVTFQTPGSLPRYGAVGCFGVRGPGVEVTDCDMLPSDQAYGFEAGKVYNLASSRYISDGGGFSGAHSDITKPAVAHAVWDAAVR
jgi:hypothetical protein